MVPFCLQPLDDLFRDLIGRLSALRAKLGHDLVETNNSDLYIIRKGKYVPANWRRGVGSPVLSPLFVIMCDDFCPFGHVLRILRRILFML